MRDGDRDDRTARPCGQSKASFVEFQERELEKEYPVLWIDAVYEKNPPLENRSEISADEIVLGDSVTVKAAACNGDNGYLYTILYREDSNQNWIESQSYSINDTLPLTPSKAGNYEICVKVRDSAGDAAEKFFTVKVHEKLTGISSLSSGVISVGQQITVNCLAKGGMGEYQYRVT